MSKFEHTSGDVWGLQIGLYQADPILLGPDNAPTMRCALAKSFLTKDAAEEYAKRKQLLSPWKAVNLSELLEEEEKEGSDVSQPAAGLATGSPDQPAPTPIVPVPMLLWCPECGERHIDTGEFATKIHHTHACQACGMVWRPAVVPTVGVRWLPGYKDRGAL